MRPFSIEIAYVMSDGSTIKVKTTNETITVTHDGDPTALKGLQMTPTDAKVISQMLEIAQNHFP